MLGESMSGNNECVPCFLVLEDGSVLKGESFGAKKAIDGEVGRYFKSKT